MLSVCATYHLQTSAPMQPVSPGLSWVQHIFAFVRVVVWVLRRETGLLINLNVMAKSHTNTVPNIQKYHPVVEFCESVQAIQSV